MHMTHRCWTFQDLWLEMSGTVAEEAMMLLHVNLPRCLALCQATGQTSSLDQTDAAPRAKITRTSMKLPGLTPLRSSVRSRSGLRLAR